MCVCVLYFIMVSICISWVTNDGYFVIYEILFYKALLLKYFFFNWIICLFITDLYKFFKYPRYKSFVRYICCKYSMGSLYFLGVIWWADFILRNSNFIFFLVGVFCVKELFANLMVLEFSLCLLLKASEFQRAHQVCVLVPVNLCLLLSLRSWFSFFPCGYLVALIAFLKKRLLISFGMFAKN